MSQKIITNLWFDTEALEAAEYYVSVFGEDSRVAAVSRYPDVVEAKAGQVLTVDFELRGQRFTAINGGPQFTFDEAISLLVECEDQEEIDYFWDTLVEGGEESQCGWLRDRYGLSWQIVPKGMAELFTADPAAAGRAMQAMFGMRKLDVAALHEAAAQEPASA